MKDYCDTHKEICINISDIKDRVLKELKGALNEFRGLKSDDPGSIRVGFSNLSHKANMLWHDIQRLSKLGISTEDGAYRSSMLGRPEFSRENGKICVHISSIQQDSFKRLTSYLEIFEGLESNDFGSMSKVLLDFYHVSDDYYNQLDVFLKYGNATQT